VFWRRLKWENDKKYILYLERVGEIFKGEGDVGAINRVVWILKGRLFFRMRMFNWVGIYKK